MHEIAHFLPSIPDEQSSKPERKATITGRFKSAAVQPASNSRIFRSLTPNGTGTAKSRNHNGCVVDLVQFTIGCRIVCRHDSGIESGHGQK